MALLGHRLRRRGYETHLFRATTRGGRRFSTSSLSVSPLVDERSGPMLPFHRPFLGNVIVRNGFRNGFPPRTRPRLMQAPPNRPARSSLLIFREKPPLPPLDGRLRPRSWPTRVLPHASVPSVRNSESRRRPARHRIGSRRARTTGVSSVEEREARAEMSGFRRSSTTPTPLIMMASDTAELLVRRFLESGSVYSEIGSPTMGIRSLSGSERRFSSGGRES